MLGYKKFMDQVDKKAYHEGEFQWQEGEYTVTRTYNWTPPGCHDSCGVLYYVKDNKLEKVEGDPLAPYNNGKLCMRCLNMMENVNDPGRVKYPLRRAGERGENKWAQRPELGRRPWPRSRRRSIKSGKSTAPRPSSRFMARGATSTGSFL